jgi:hypothetical protein
LNESGARVELHWLDGKTKAPSLLSNPYIYDGAPFQLNTFVGHEFEVREVPSDKTGVCSDETCKVARFVINENEDQGELLIGMSLMEFALELQQSFSADATLVLLYSHSSQSWFGD